MTPSTNTASTYVMGRSESETRRLMMQAQMYGRVMHRFLDDADVVVGMKVLDIGSGAGDVAFVAADIVGPTGSVVGIDANPEVLDIARSRAEAEQRTNVSFVEGDCRTASLPDDFDAVIGRFVLMYTGDVTDTLSTIAGRVRPGGVVAFAEAEFTAVLGYLHADGPPLFPLLWEWAAAAFQHAGNHTAMAPLLYRAFVAAGLGAPQMFFHAPLGGGDDWIGYEWCTESIRSLLPLLELYGIATPDEVGVDTLSERIRAEVTLSGFPIMLLPMVTAWAHKPIA